MLLQTTEEHLLIKTRCVVFKLKETTTKMPRWTAKVAFIRVRINVRLRSSYVTIFVTKITFAMFLLKLSTLSDAIFLFVSLVLSLSCVYEGGE